LDAPSFNTGHHGRATFVEQTVSPLNVLYFKNYTSHSFWVSLQPPEALTFRTKRFDQYNSCSSSFDNAGSRAVLKLKIGRTDRDFDHAHLSNKVIPTSFQIAHEKMYRSDSFDV